MGNAQSCFIASLSVCSAYLVYTHIYRSHVLLRTNVIDSERLPSFGYLFFRYLIRALVRRPGHLYARQTEECEVSYTVRNCRLDTRLLRRFCSTAGYGWDFPDSEYRDIPLCFPELLCHRLLLIVLSAGSFRLSPAGLVRLQQSVRKLQPVDELRRGVFTLQARVLQYRPVDAGVEVDIQLSATSCSNCLVWESVLTLLSKNRFHKATRPVPENEKGQPARPVSEDVKTVEIRVPWTAGLRCVWSFSDYSPHRLLSLPARLFGCRSQGSLSLWALSVCLAEIEKHKGAQAVRAPVSVTAHFKEPLSVPGRERITFWETTEGEGPSSAQGLNFHMEQHSTRAAHMVGVICRA
ncbi:uncharacterized protein LOC115365968 [Myripristis murdjan]|uniref:uncharacterized protein LOC115365968 n=1 Tax=Myripristis murdjan TaxID=586833 RepID=UPI001175E5B8|nr:uncharacterized protein LOC115365968 [Myripristis murdjan]